MKPSSSIERRLSWKANSIALGTDRTVLGRQKVTWPTPWPVFSSRSRSRPIIPLRTTIWARRNLGSGWLMTSLSSSPSLVALIEAAVSLPIMLLALPAGALADIVDRRRLLIGIQVYLMLVAVGWAATLPSRAPWGSFARRWVGAAMVLFAVAIVTVPAVPAGSIAPSQPGPSPCHTSCRR